MGQIGLKYLIPYCPSNYNFRVRTVGFVSMVMGYEVEFGKPKAVTGEFFYFEAVAVGKDDGQSAGTVGEWLR